MMALGSKLEARSLEPGLKKFRSEGCTAMQAGPHVNHDRPFGMTMSELRVATPVSQKLRDSLFSGSNVHSIAIPCIQPSSKNQDVDIHIF